jgi:catechol 2,3-dioxygenase-like lactoylglutathione lyase family enzyme
MAARITELVLDAHDPDRLAAFWCEVLGWAVIERREHEVEIGPVGDPAAATLVLYRSDEPKRGKLRLHLDLRPSGGEHAGELVRLRALGAVPADIGQGEVPWAVLADPEGNEFCLLHPLPG